MYSLIFPLSSAVKATPFLSSQVLIAHVVLRERERERERNAWQRQKCLEEAIQL